MLLTHVDSSIQLKALAEEYLTTSEKILTKKKSTGTVSDM